MSQHDQTDVSKTKEQRKSKKIGLMIKNSRRFTNAINMPEETKKPIYLPKKIALDNAIDQRISQTFISSRNLIHIIPDEIYLLDPTRTV